MILKINIKHSLRCDKMIWKFIIVTIHVGFEWVTTRAWDYYILFELFSFSVPSFYFLRLYIQCTNKLKDEFSLQKSSVFVSPQILVFFFSHFGENEMNSNYFENWKSKWKKYGETCVAHKSSLAMAAITKLYLLVWTFGADLLHTIRHTPHFIA